MQEYPFIIKKLGFKERSDFSRAGGNSAVKPTLDPVFPDS